MMSTHPNLYLLVPRHHRGGHPSGLLHVDDAGVTRGPRRAESACGGEVPQGKAVQVDIRLTPGRKHLVVNQLKVYPFQSSDFGC